MRIAVTYDNGDIFQHFGKTEKFKLYDVENGEITARYVVDTNGSGHGALAGFLRSVNAAVHFQHQQMEADLYRPQAPGAFPE